MRVEGRVFVEDTGRGIAGATVELRDSHAVAITKTETDTAGHYRLENRFSCFPQAGIPAWYLSVTVSEFGRVRPQSFIHCREDVQTIDVLLEPAASCSLAEGDRDGDGIEDLVRCTYRPDGSVAMCELDDAADGFVDLREFWTYDHTGAIGCELVYNYEEGETRTDVRRPQRVIERCYVGEPCECYPDTTEDPWMWAEHHVYSCPQ